MMALLFAALVLAADAPVSNSGQLQSKMFDSLYYLYCSSGDRALDRDRALEVSREIVRGEYGLKQFTAFWGPTCVYEESRRLAREAHRGRIDSEYFSLLVGRKCREGHALKPQEAVRAAREAAAGAIDKGVFMNAWDESCIAADSMRAARHDILRRRVPRAGAKLQEKQPRGAPQPETPKVY